MQLLIVHDDAEVGEQLMTMVVDYTSHKCDLVHSAAAAHHWADKHQCCDLLLVQVQGSDIDGLVLAGSLSEPFAGLQTFFFPAYPTNRHAVEIAKTKIFPEPIDGERLLEAIEEAEKTDGGPDLFAVMEVLQMCCLSERSGAIQFVQKSQAGIVYLRSGKIVHAESTSVGINALREILSWGLVEFAYDAAAQAKKETMSLRWGEVVPDMVRTEESERQTIETKSADSKPNTESPKKRGLFGFFRRE